MIQNEVLDSACSMHWGSFAMGMPSFHGASSISKPCSATSLRRTMYTMKLTKNRKLGIFQLSRRCQG